jgi:hypothetical protein
VEDAILEAIFSVLSEKIDPEILKKADTIAIKKKLKKRVTQEMFYQLLKNGKITLEAGFGTVVVKDKGTKTKKVFDKSTGKMVEKKVDGKKIVYQAGKIVKEFL